MSKISKMGVIPRVETDKYIEYNKLIYHKWLIPWADTTNHKLTSNNTHADRVDEMMTNTIEMLDMLFNIWEMYKKKCILKLEKRYINTIYMLSRQLIYLLPNANIYTRGYLTYSNIIKSIHNKYNFANWSYISFIDNNSVKYKYNDVAKTIVKKDLDHIMYLLYRSLLDNNKSTVLVLNLFCIMAYINNRKNRKIGKKRVI